MFIPVLWKSHLKNSAEQNFNNPSSNFGCNWTSFQGKNKRKLKMPTRVWGNVTRGDQKPETFLGPKHKCASPNFHAKCWNTSWQIFLAELAKKLNDLASFSSFLCPNLSELNDLVLEPLRSLFFCSSIFFKCQVIYTLTELLRNYVSIELPRHTDTVCIQAVKEASALQAGDVFPPQNQ